MIQKTTGRDKVLTDDIHESPVDEWLMHTRTIISLVILALLALPVIYLVRRFSVDKPVTFDGIEEHFKYGSIGSEPGGSLSTPVGGVLPPYAVFKALPEICPEMLPGGYAQVGLLFQPG